MQRKSGAPQLAFPRGRLIKPAQPFSDLHLSEQDTGPLPLGSPTIRTTDKLRNNALKSPIGPKKDIPKRFQYQKGRRSLRRRRIIISIVSSVLAILILGGIFAATLVHNLLNSNSLLAAPPTIQVSMDAQALHNLIAQGLNTSQDSISDVNIVPLANNALKISLNMVISGSGINRMLPLEIDTTLGGSMQPHKDILTIQHFIRDGVDAGPQAAASMQTTINQLLEKVLPLPGTNNSVLALASLSDTSGSIKQSNSRVCGHGSILLHLGLPLEIQSGITKPYVLPVDVDSYIGLDQKNNLQFHLDRITYGQGKNVGDVVTNAARKLINQLFSGSNPSSGSNLSPGSSSSSNANDPVNQIKFLSLNTSSQSVCGKNAEMLVLQLGPEHGK